MNSTSTAPRVMYVPKGHSHPKASRRGTQESRTCLPTQQLHLPMLVKKAGLGPAIPFRPLLSAGTAHSPSESLLKSGRHISTSIYASVRQAYQYQAGPLGKQISPLRLVQDTL